MKPKITAGEFLQAAATLKASTYGRRADEAYDHFQEADLQIVDEIKSLLDAAGFELEAPEDASRFLDARLFVGDAETVDHIVDINKMVEPEKALRVRIDQCSNEALWYSECVGETFELAAEYDDWYAVHLAGKKARGSVLKCDAVLLPEPEITPEDPPFTPLVITAETEPTHFGWNSGKVESGKYGLLVATGMNGRLPYLILEITSLGCSYETFWFEKKRKLKTAERSAWRENNK